MSYCHFIALIYFISVLEIALLLFQLYNSYFILASHFFISHSYIYLLLTFIIPFKIQTKGKFQRNQRVKLRILRNNGSHSDSFSIFKKYFYFSSIYFSSSDSDRRLHWFIGCRRSLSGCHEKLFRDSILLIPL